MNEDTRFLALTDIIEYYMWLDKPLVGEQRKQLIEAKFEISKYGEKSDKWVGLAQELLGKK